MRTTLRLSVLCLSLLAATQASASASFANRSLGIGVGGFRLLGDDQQLIDYGVPITLEGTYYIESGFDLYARIPLMLLYQRQGVTSSGGGGLVLATGGQVGFRYFFSEENLRPYIGLHLAGLYVFRDSALAGGRANFMFGPGVGVGLDLFVADSISIGVRAYTDMFITLNAPVAFSLGGALNACTYF
jgi:outer membrane protein W